MTNVFKKISIGKKCIGQGERCFIIAEAGVNHNGDAKLAKRLIDMAKNAGADAVKFQTFKAEEIVTARTPMAGYQQKNLGENESHREMLKKLELKYEDFIELKKYCDNKDIIFLSTPHTENAIDFLEPLVPLYKIGSGDLTNLPFLEKVAQKGKPIILSTGMSTLMEVKEAVNTIINKKNKKIILLHCTTNYPCPLGEVNLMAMKTLENELGLPVGYSDHTEGILISVAAVALGACVIEKHFTLDKGLRGPDHKASLEPQEFKEMIQAIRAAEKALGDGVKKPSRNEDKIKGLIRKSITAKVNIPIGAVIYEDMLAIKRPGKGIPPKYLFKIIGAKAKKNIAQDKIVRWGDLIIV
jgi:N-acetylneuraminate synthase